MSLRLRLFLVLAGLVAVLLAAQVWWVRSLADEMSTEVEAVAVTVGRAVASLVEPTDASGTAASDEEPPAAAPHHRLIVRLETRDGESDPAAAAERLRALAPALDPLPPEVLREILERRRQSAPGENAAAEPIVVDGKTYSFTAVGSDEVDGGRAAGERGPEVVFLGAPRHGSALTVLQPGLGQHRIPIPQAGLRSRLDRFGRRMIAGTLALLAAGLVVAAILAHRVTAPLRQLAAAAREVGRGHLGARVATPAGGEVGEAIAAFDRMAERLEQLDAEARRLEEHRHLGEIGEVARGLAHSLRNPLHALGLSVEELADRAADDDAAAELAAAARRQIGRVDRALRSFMTLAGGGSAAAVSAVAPRSLVDDVVLEALQDGRGGAAIEVREPAGRVAPLAAVEPELRAVVQALVMNAVEASPPGGAVEVELAPREDDDEGLVLRVLDRGPGLAPEVRRRLFTPHLSTKPGGAGMGLYLAHRIATSRYGGALRLADRDGGGTAAILELGPRAATGEAATP